MAICTWNRCRLLEQTLLRLTELTVPPHQSWELLLVDNASTDQTQAVVSQFQDRLPLVPLIENKPGHSNARNCAIQHASGQYIVWTDDDVLVATDWLTHYDKAFQAWPQASFFGGTVTPWFEAQPPLWFEQNWQRFKTFFAVRELGNQTRPFQEGETPFGANMAFKTDVLRQFTFDPQHGHVGSTARGGDETDVFQRMRQAGHTGVWVGNACVEHFIPVARMNKRFLWDYARRIARQATPRADDSASLGGVPRWLIKLYLQEMLACGWRSWRADDRWAELFLRTAALRGEIDEYRRLSSTSPAQQ